MDFLKIFGYLILILHGMILPISIFISLFIQNFYINFFILLYYTFILFGWLIFGNCILTPLENKLLGKNEKYENGSERSGITIFIEKYTNLDKNTIYLIFSISPLFVISIILCKFFLYNLI